MRKGLSSHGREDDKLCIMNIPQHIRGNDLSDALTLLQQLAEVRASGTLLSSCGRLRLREGRVVKVEGKIVQAMIQGLEADWGWRRVPGLPNGDMSQELCIILMREIS